MHLCRLRSQRQTTARRHSNVSRDKCSDARARVSYLFLFFLFFLLLFFFEEEYNAVNSVLLPLFGSVFAALLRCLFLTCMSSGMGIEAWKICWFPRAARTVRREGEFGLCTMNATAAVFPTGSVAAVKTDGSASVFASPSQQM